MNFQREHSGGFLQRIDVTSTADQTAVTDFFYGTVGIDYFSSFTTGNDQNFVRTDLFVHEDVCEEVNHGDKDDYAYYY